MAVVFTQTSALKSSSSRGTCLLEHINLGACRAWRSACCFCLLVWKNWLIFTAKLVLKNWWISDSRRRSSGWTWNARTRQSPCAGRGYVRSVWWSIESTPVWRYDTIVTPAARKIVKALQQGINAAAAVARMANMDRAFAIAPTASCSYRYTDRAGYTTTPELAPPIGRTVDRDSSTFGVETLTTATLKLLKKSVGTQLQACSRWHYGNASPYWSLPRL